jgi:hypothetical protein
VTADPEPRKERGCEGFDVATPRMILRMHLHRRDAEFTERISTFGLRESKVSWLCVLSGSAVDSPTPEKPQVDVQQ